MGTAFIWIFFILLYIVFYTYLGYGILLWFLVKLKEKRHPRQKSDLPDELPEVTLFITAYNEEDVVAAKMENSRSLDYPKEKLKIVWVTDGSTDSTNEKLAVYSDVTVYFQSERKGKTAAMNRGIQFVSTPITIFTDANTQINREAVKELVAAFSDKKTGCAAGEKRIAVKEKDSASSGGEGAYWRYESKLKELDARLYSVVGAAGELFAIRTELYEQMPDDTLLDDFILSLRINQKGYKTAYCKEAYAIESGSLDMKEEEKRKVRISAGGLQSVWRLRALLNIFRYGILSFQFISHRVLRWTLTPVAFFLLFPISVALVLIQTNPIGLYDVALFFQCLFYGAAFIGYYLSKHKIRNTKLYIPYYFLFMNLNVFKGLAYLKKKKGTAIWEKAKRQ